MGSDWASDASDAASPTRESEAGCQPSAPVARQSRTLAATQPARHQQAPERSLTRVPSPTAESPEESYKVLAT